MAAGVDYIAMSFVQRGEDVEALRALVPSSVRIIAKIEKDTALRNIKGILRAADAIMVARGDLGVELPFEEVPLTQKRLIREANLHGKPVITATQMLESMVHAPRPTRAEASDVANAILDGTDAVMLSAETAVGRLPAGVGRGDGADRPGARAAAARAEPGVRHRGRAAGGEDGPPAERRGRRGDDDAHRVGDRRGGLRRGRTAAGAGHRLPHLQRLHRPHRRRLPPVGADPRGDARARHLPRSSRSSGAWCRCWCSTSRLRCACCRWRAAAAPVARAWRRSGDRIVVTAGVPFDTPGTTNLLKVEAV